MAPFYIGWSEPLHLFELVAEMFEGRIVGVKERFIPVEYVELVDEIIEEAENLLTYTRLGLGMYLPFRIIGPADDISPFVLRRERLCLDRTPTFYSMV